MVQVTVLRLVGYREWTEGLGPDRERDIQLVQARLHEAIVREFFDRGAFAHPARYDYVVAVTNGLGPGDIESAVTAVSSQCPVPISSGTASRPRPLDAEVRASRLAISAGLDSTSLRVSTMAPWPSPT